MAHHMKQARRESRQGSMAELPVTGYQTTSTSAPGEGTPLVAKPTNDLAAIWAMTKGSYVNVLLLVAPFAYAAYAGDWGGGPVFLLNFLTMVPLASMLGGFTEELAMHMGETIGGLVNATFGNAVEVVIAIFALKDGQIRVVQASMLGSILSNLLLVLGTCFFMGGLRYKEQKFNEVNASANTSLLLLSSLALVLPTPFSTMVGMDEQVLEISRMCAVMMLFMYVQLLIFQLYTHVDMFAGTEEEEEEPSMSLFGAGAALLVTTLLVAAFSEFLVSSIDGVTESWGISKTFVGIILLPVVGNAVEHVTSVSVAMKNKMELAMGVAVGSATQVSLFVVPVVVIAGWMMGQPMSLAFTTFDICVFLLSVLIVHGIVQDGASNWLEGSMLLTAYLMLGISFWFLEE